MSQTERDTGRWVKERVAEAQKAADESVERERRAAEEDAEEQQEEVRSEVGDEIEEAQGEADAAQETADELVEDATEKMAEARRLAQEAAEAAQAAAEEANRQARELAQQADQQASEAQAQVTQAEQIREDSEATAKDAAGKLGGSTTNGDLDSYNKPELVELAAGIGIEGRTTMTKEELHQGDPEGLTIEHPQAQEPARSAARFGRRCARHAGRGQVQPAERQLRQARQGGPADGRRPGRSHGRERRHLVATAS